MNMQTALERTLPQRAPMEDGEQFLSIMEGHQQEAEECPNRTQ
jgi:hypothetical protein